MVRALYTLAVGLVGAGIVHIAILFLLPTISDRDAYSVLAERLPPYEVAQVVPGGTTDGLARDLDPLFSALVCRFDLEDGPVHITGGRQKVPFWSLSLYDDGGQNVFSLVDRTAAGQVLDVVVVDPRQMTDMRNDLPAAADRSLFVETGISRGLVMVRAFVPDPSFAEAIAAYLRGVECRPL
jgi:uncharacterized membrane protein